MTNSNIGYTPEVRQKVDELAREAGVSSTEFLRRALNYRSCCVREDSNKDHYPQQQLSHSEERVLRKINWL